MYLKRIICGLLTICILTGCSVQQTTANKDKKIKIGVMLSDVGLGDQSFSDSAFNGLMKARDQLGVQFDYREISETKTYAKGIEQLVKEGNDIVVGLGFMVQPDLEKIARKYPKQHFILIDSVSNLKNVTSITFKEDQGSFLAGVAAALATKSNKLGFLGGDDVPLIHKFERGFIAGAKAVNPKNKIESIYANNFGDDKLGASIAEKMISHGDDVLYAAAGFTGVGLLKTAQLHHKLAIGVDSDQYFYAEKAVITSMQKNVDVALYKVASDLVQHKRVKKGNIQLGISENGVALAPTRVISFTPLQQKVMDRWKEKLLSGQVQMK
jgi:basic membrane protein A